MTSGNSNPSHSRESERRQATIMFADISGFTTISDNMDPEEATSLMNECFSMMGQAIESHGGIIDKFMGDCVMAVFGAPVAIEDAPRKAVNSAIEIRSSISRFNKEKRLAQTLGIHIGINTGEVISGDVGSQTKREYTVMGDAVNMASRLEDLSEKGQILVGLDTYRSTRSDFVYRELSSVFVKGKEEPVYIYELLSRNEIRRRDRTALDRMIFSKMVGRDKELSMMELLVSKGIEGEGTIINVIGEAGIGKSRLIAELKRKEVIKRVTLLEGRALSIGKNLSFHPIIDLLKNWAGIEETDNENECREKLIKTIESIHREKTSEIFPFTATLMGITLTGNHAKRVKDIKSDALSKFILKNLRDLFAAASGKKPLVIIIEDLHWADKSSIEMLESLFKLVERYSVLFINVFRPRYKDTSERLNKKIKKSYGQHCFDITLQALNEDQSEILVQNFLKIDGMPQHIRQQIIERSCGNPFFIEEIIRELIDSGAIEIRHGKLDVTQKIHTAVIPVTINEVIMTRIDRLDRETRELLKLASVIGRSFFYRVLTRMAESVHEIDQKIDYLKSIQLIIERRRMMEIEYLFKHALTQEAIYKSILLKRRKELHLIVAKSVEKVFKERLYDFYGMLAYHYSQGEDLGKTEEYLIKAGESALKSSASAEALHYYQNALELYVNKSGEAVDPERMAMLEKNIGYAYSNRGHYVEAAQHLNKALEWSGWRSRKGKISVFFNFLSGLVSLLAEIYIISKRKVIPDKNDEFLFELFYKKIACYSVLDPKKLFIDSITGFSQFKNLGLVKMRDGYMHLGFSLMFSFTGLSFRISRKIIEVFTKYINRENILHIFYLQYVTLTLYLYTGEWNWYYDSESVEKILSLGHLSDACYCITFDGYIKTEQGLVKHAQKSVDKLEEIARTYENEDAKVCYYQLNSKLLMKMRKLPEALALSDKGIILAGKFEQVPRVIYFYGIKANILLLMGDFEKARQTLILAAGMVRGNGFVPPHFLSRYVMSQLLFDLYLLEKALKNPGPHNISKIKKRSCKSAKKALRTSKKYACDRTEALRLMGSYCWISGKQKKALVWWERSILEGERLDAKLELSRTYLEVARRLFEKKGRYDTLKGIGREEYLKKAQHLFSQLDLDWDLKELDSLKLKTA